jgi:adenosine deaminase
MLFLCNQLQALTQLLEKKAKGNPIMDHFKNCLRRAWLALAFLFFASWIMRRLAKLLLHEHLDCSLRPGTMLELMREYGYPADFPASIRELIDGGKFREASSAYQQHIAKFARSSLANYVNTIRDHVVPLMQTRAALYRITKERIEDAVKDGIIGMELRFAPQFHTQKGLTLDEVMLAVIAAVDESPIPVKLCICSGRHEDRAMAKVLVDLAIKYKKYVGVFDLACDEHAFPGVLSWWIEEATRLVDEGIILTVHLWETEEPTDEDMARIKRYKIRRVGHGFRGNRQGDLWLEICPTSNVVTGQVDRLEDHKIDRLLREGRLVTLNTDGTLLTLVQLTDECMNMRRVFGWGRRQFYTVFTNALDASSFSPEQKLVLRAKGARSYGER